MQPARGQLTLALATSVLCALTTPSVRAAHQPPAKWPSIDWPAFLSRSDMVWQSLPDRWDRGAFTGNGLLGAMIYVNAGQLVWELGRADVVDRQISPEPMTASPRLPLGFLRWQGCEPNEGSMRLDLWNAQVTASVSTPGNTTTNIESWTHAERNLIGIAVKGGGCVGVFDVDAAKAVSHRSATSKGRHAQPQANPPAQQLVEGTRRYTVQELKGGAHVTAVESFVEHAQHITYVTIAKGRSAREARARADQTLNDAKRRGWDRLTSEHQQFWHNYYPQSFVSLPHSQLESFYWLQMYKLASASRPNGPIIDTLGPWYHQTPWPGLWWNLNVQLTYWPLYAANRLSQAQSLVRGLRNSQQTLRANARPRPGMAIGRTSAQDLRSPTHLIDLERAETPDAPREYSNLLWALHNLWMHYTHSMDETIHRQVVAMLSEAVTHSLSLLTLQADGRLHLPLAISPEYSRPAADTNYDLSLLTWGLQTLLLPENRKLLPDAKRTLWARTLKQLPPYPVDATGLMIGRDTPLAESHRHFSHLMMVYPLGLLSPEVKANRELIERSLAHWIGMEGGLEGYSFVVASAISSRLGKGNDASAFLQELISRYVRRNTMYMEAGPVIETPLAAAQSIHEMLLQSRGDAVFVFPALPQDWQDVSFRNLRAPGAFLISAQRHGGQTTLVSVESLVGAPLQLVLPPGASLEPTGLPADRWRKIDAQKYELRLRKGETLWFTGPGTPSALSLEVPQPNAIVNPFGSRKENAWLPSDVASSNPVQGKPLVTNRVATIDKSGVIPSWQLLNRSLSTVFTDSGGEEIFWRHTSCDPCASQARVSTPADPATWVTVSTTDGCFDFRKLLPKASRKDTIAYLRTTIESDHDADMTLQVGVNDQGRVWWWANGERPSPKDSILVNTQGSTLGLNEPQVHVRLRKGLNHVFVKTINQAGRWGACIKPLKAPPTPPHPGTQ